MIPSIDKQNYPHTYKVKRNGANKSKEKQKEKQNPNKLKHKNQSIMRLFERATRNFELG